MRAFNATLAVLVGLVCWSLVAVLAGGVAPMGKSGGTEGMFFLMPIIIFALPTAVYALIRGHVGTGLWLGAISPVFGFLNFALAVSAITSGPVSDVPATRTVLAMATGWALLLAISVLVIRSVKRVDS
jgi:hypothetical protein